MDFNRSICDILQERANEYFGKERVFKVGACVCLKQVSYNPFHEFIDFLNDFVKGSEHLSYDTVPKHPLGLCVNIRYNTIIVAQLLQQ